MTQLILLIRCVFPTPFLLPPANNHSGEETCHARPDRSLPGLSGPAGSKEPTGKRRIVALPAGAKINGTHLILIVRIRCVPFAPFPSLGFAVTHAGSRSVRRGTETRRAAHGSITPLQRRRSPLPARPHLALKRLAFFERDGEKESPAA